MSTIVAVIGVGYVGEHLVTEFSKHYPVIAYDIDQQRLDQVASNTTVHRLMTSLDQVASNTTVHRLMTTRKAVDLCLATHILISVPTDVFHDGTINTTTLRKAIATVLEHAQYGATVVIESSVAVGMTRDLFGTSYLRKGLKIGMSPERVDPGRTNIAYDSIPKIISGLNSESLAAIADLYRPVFSNIVSVSSVEVAEMTKLYENCQRMISIAYVNEMADACLSHNIDPMEVCEAASTKPFGYQPYTPSLGVGGHCIPVNPFYLLSNSQWPCLELATRKMRSRPANIGDRIMADLMQRIPSRRPRILVVGVGFKKGQSVLSNAPGVDLIVHLLSTYDVYIEFADPLVAESALPYVPKLEDPAAWNTSNIDESFDAVVVAVAQDGLDLTLLKQLRKAKVFNFSAALSWLRRACFLRTLHNGAALQTCLICPANCPLLLRLSQSRQ
ncbi:UDP-N-acetyl-D-glucosamine 6-dehydrogenase [Cyphellophora attinorum]|uniref:UDP-N-acetyl-D-glucosamine 6-dehydrogenase n=1 Tax=Cyphellophora attinorum TaxID=1664694 RepID=A0A0N1H7S1_9EURO|nr:UDP-N-acetyl-D-glucosamine 6-dehydrogenase [Phialophora attinorum]KPI42693.1 UDP-N-acetyl-D-glucosamine 6-dehydrogenase [Phialophora attinorum]